MRSHPSSPMPAISLRRPGGALPIASSACRLVLWFKRCLERQRQRLALGELDHRLLRDISVSPAEADREIRKRPWK